MSKDGRPAASAKSGTGRQQGTKDTPRVTVPALAPAGRIRLSGTGAEKIWARAKALPPLRLAAECQARPLQASKARVVRAGRWLLFGLDAAEGDGVVVRHATHGADLWYDDAFAVDLVGDDALKVYVNALGSIRCYRRGHGTMAPITHGAVQAAARIGPAGWRVELAVDLGEVLDEQGGAGECRLRISRQRQPRGLTPFEEPAVPPPDAAPLVLRIDKGWQGAAKVALEAVGTQRFAAPAVLEAGLVEKAPAGPKQWATMPAVLLRPEDGRVSLDPDFQPTEVRAAVTAESLVLRVRCDEAHPAAIADAGKELWLEDSIEVFLGPERFNYLQVVSNPRGKCQAARGKSGGRRVRPMPPPEGVAVQARKTAAGEWTVEMTIPFRVVASMVGAPADCHPSRCPWRVNVVRNRPAKDKLGQAGQVAYLGVTLAGNSHCPARFGVLRPVRPSGKAMLPAEPARPALPRPVLDARRRAQVGAATAVKRWIGARSEQFDKQYEAAFAKADTAEAWRALAAKVRGNLARAMFPATGGRMPQRGDLNAKAVYSRPGRGYRAEGLIFESQPGLPVPVTLYVPTANRPAGAPKRPCLIMVPAHHTGRNSTDLLVLGANFARAGGIAAAVESIGSGERSVTGLWAHKNHQRCLFNVQALLAGDDLGGWTAFDISRTVDYLLARGDVDPNRIAIVGGVAGGGDVSALAAALDDRIDVSIPFNFSTTRPMSHWYDPLRSYHGARAGGLAAWMVDAVIAPRKLLQAQEFAWRPGEQASYDRFEKVFGLLKAKANLARLHGGPNTHATHFHAVHRAPMYRILSRWFGMKLPTSRSAEYASGIRRSGLECFDSPAGRKHLAALKRTGRLRQPHELAADLAKARLAASVKRCRRGPAPLAAALAGRLDELLGETAPVKAAAARPLDRGTWRGAKVQGFWLPAEAGGGKLGLAAWLLVPAKPGRRPAVVAIARDGKARFLAERGDEVAAMLKAGVAVCLVDVRGCGETCPGPSRLPDGAAAYLAYGMWGLNDSLPARQLKDVRTVLAWLAGRKDIDPARLGLWGEGLRPPNARADEPILFDEVGFRQVSPTPMQLAEPAGGALAMLAALWPVEAGGRKHRVRAVLARGTLVSMLSVLDRRHYYVPIDAIVPGLLRAADVPVVAEALRDAGATVRLQDLRDGSNRACGPEHVRRAWGRPAPAGYAARPTAAAADAIIKALTAKGR